MWEATTRWIDRKIIALACRHTQAAPALPPRREEAERLLQSANFFGPSKVPLPMVHRNAQQGFEFTSLVQTSWETNNRVRGRWLRAAGARTTAPAVLLLHGWAAEGAYRYQFPYLTWRLHRAGVHVAMMELPYHGSRRPPRSAGWTDFISSDLFHMVQAAQQAVCDIRSIMGWMQERTGGPVGLWGFSLGGWLGGLAMAADRRIDFSVLQVPVVEIKPALESIAFCAPARRSIEQAPMSLDLLDLRTHAAAIGRRPTLLVAGRYDEFEAIERVRNLARALPGGELWDAPHGHITGQGSPGLAGRISRWIGRR